jgi:hypothetical protein
MLCVLKWSRPRFHSGTTVREPVRLHSRGCYCDTWHCHRQGQLRLRHHVRPMVLKQCAARLWRGEWLFNINKKFWEEWIAYFPRYDTGHIENYASNNSLVACVFVSAVTFPPSRCLAAIMGFLSSRCLSAIRGFLPSRFLTTIRGFLPSRFVATIGGFLRSRCLATIWGLLQSRCLATIHTHTATWSHKPTLIFQNNESGLNMHLHENVTVLN